MKRLALMVYGILVVLYVFLPIGHLIGVATGYTFSIFNNSIFAVLLGIVSIFSLILVFREKPSMNRVNRILSFLLFPLSIITGYCLIFGSTWRFTGLFIGICCVCGFIILVKDARPIWLQIIVAILSCLIGCLLVLFVFFDMCFGNFVGRTIEKVVYSPEGTYVAEVINSDQGALGGNTLVDVSCLKNINLLICQFADSPGNVYRGKWLDFETMEIYWEDDDTLVINDKVYHFGE